MFADDLAREFFAWERPARGYALSEYPVWPEPLYRPFGAGIERTPPIDDARRPGFWQSLFQVVPPAPVKPSSFKEPEPEVFPEEDEEIAELQLLLPSEFRVSQALASELLGSFHNCRFPISFELVASHKSIQLQLACRQSDLSSVRQNLAAFFPDIRARKGDGLLRSAWTERDRYGVLIDFGLTESFFQPLSVSPLREIDPLTGIVGALSNLEYGELAVVQVLFQQAIQPWGRALTEALEFSGDAAAISLAKQKLSDPLQAVLVRTASFSPESEAAFEIARNVGGAIIAATRSEWNELIALNNDGYESEIHAEDFLARTTHRTGMVWNLAELATLVHMPGTSVRTEKLIRATERTKQAPNIVTGNATLIGVNEHEGETIPVSLSANQRMRHTYLVGASGTGKSTLLLNLIAQDIEQGVGVAVLDPHGDLIDDVLSHIPPHRFNDVVLFDPADENFPVGFNIFSARSELERTLLASDLVSIFRRLSTSWGDQMTSVLGNAILALLESSSGGTLLELRRFLVDPDFRKTFLASVADPEIVYFWQKEFPLLKGIPQAPLLTRLDMFLRPKLIRHMVAQKDNVLDFRMLMDNRKIFLGRLSQGAIGEENAFLLGSLIVSKFHQTAMSRQEQSGSRRQDFFVYVDEFHHFITPSMAALLSGARKYRLGLTLAHQDIRQLQSRDSEIASSIFANAMIRIMFRVGDSDARALADGVSYFEARDLLNLGTGEAIVRVERSDFDFNLKVNPPAKLDPLLASKRREEIRDLSRKQYATPLNEVLTKMVTTPSAPAPQALPELNARLPKPPSSRPESSTIEETPRDSELDEPRHRDAPLPRLAGRGGTHHKYLQQLLKRFGEARGYKATIEQKILDGAGIVDVALEKEGSRVAFEVSVGNDLAYEISNVHKCLAAGFDVVALVSSEKRILGQARGLLAEALSSDQLQSVQVLSPDDLISFFDTLEAESQTTEDTVKGYKVRTEYTSLSESERKNRREAIGKIIWQSARRMKND